MTEIYNKTSKLVNCPKCDSKLPPKFSTGRIVCSKCGWTSQPKTISTNNIENKQVDNQVPKHICLKALMNFAKTRNGERVLITTGTFIFTSILWFGTSSWNSNQINLSAFSKKSTATTSGSTSQSNLEQNNSIFTKSYSIQGNLTLIDSDIAGIPSNCYGSGGYEDIGPAMPVTVRDGSGKILAIGKTGSGYQPEDSEYSSVQCSFDFKVDNVPKADFYSIEVGRRGALNYSFDEIQQKDWRVAFSLT